jgi:hypothetical protein
MTTRRDALKMIAGPDVIDMDHCRMVCAALMVEAGLERGSDAIGAFWRLFLNDVPLPAELEPERGQCRKILLAILSRLDA